MTVLDSSTFYSFAGKDGQTIAGVVGLASILATTLLYLSRGSSNKDEFPKLRGIQLYHAWNFFQRRYDFLHSNFERKGDSFSFDVLNHKIIALTGEEARHAFFSNPALNLEEGNKILFGMSPRTDDIDPTAENKESHLILIKRYTKIFTKPRIENVLPTMLEDIIRKAGEWESESKNFRIDPFVDVYDLVFLMTARLTTCHDLTKNDADLKRVRELFTTHEKSITPGQLLFPWFPSSAKESGKKAATEMFTIICTHIERRRRGVPGSDAIDVLIAEGETTLAIARFIMTVLYAGIFSTGVVSCWTLIHLATHPEWKAKCKKEIQDLISRHAGDTTSSTTLYEKLAAIPLSAWEDELPVMEACIKESQRVSMAKVLLRRNLRDEFRIGGKVVARGDFLAYSLCDAHLNSEYYPDPDRYDPDRWLQPGLAPTATYPFLGFGAGRHSCMGVKMAKLEMKFISAMFLTRYDYELVDKNGKFPRTLPAPNRNDFNQARPRGEPCYFKLRKVME